MAKPTGPLLSFGASGAIAKTVVYANWKGRNYVRRYVVPANPQTAEQSKTRDVFAWASSVWKQLGPLTIEPWDRFATGQVLTGRNAFIGKNVNALRGDADLADMIGSPGAKGGLPATSIAAASGVAEIVVTFVTPTVPDGWTLDEVVAFAIPDQDPATGVLYATVEAKDDSTPFDTVTLTGLDTVLYFVKGWVSWTKPNGTKAYGPSLTDSATPT
jgi:hypothetical protein